MNNINNIINRNGLTISLNEKGQPVVTNNGQSVGLANWAISSVSELEKGPADNKKLAEVLRSRQQTHLLGGKVGLTAEEAVALENAINNHPEMIARRAKDDQQLAEIEDYYRHYQNVIRGYAS